jgi:heme O synthase-like polyprenyltransferase
MTVRAEMAQVKSAALSGAGTVAVVTPPLKSDQATGSTDSAQIKPSKLSDYLCLTKPEVTFLVLIATGTGWLHGG